MRNRVLSAVLFPLLCGLSLDTAAAGDSHPIRFEPNRGQAESRWAYVARTADGPLFLGNRQVRVGGSVLDLIGAAPDAVWEPLEPLPGVAHYLLGSDAAGWVLDVPTFGAVRQRSAYPGIDVVVRGANGRVDLEFDVAPTADPARIGVALDGSGWRLSAPEPGSDPLRIHVSPERNDGGSVQESPRLAADAEGNLYLAGHVDDGRATAFVTKLDAAGREILRTTYVDGLDADAPIALAVSPSGEIALAGARQGDAVVLRLDRTGRSILSRSRLGGSGDDAALAVSFGREANVWFAGRTASADLPVTADAPRPALRGGSDAFVAAIDAGGSVVFASYLGGDDADEAQGVALDADGAVYLTGTTGEDAFVAKIDATDRSIEYFTPFGGSGADSGLAIAVSSTGEPVIAGSTSSPDLPIVGGGAHAALAGGTDAFVARWDRTGRSLVQSAYLGGPSEDGALGVALDRDDRAWVTGRRGIGDDADAFVTRVASAGAGTPVDKIIAGDRGDVATGVVVNRNGDAVVGGFSRSDDLPEADRPEAATGGTIFTATVKGGESTRGVCPGTRNFTGLVSNAWENVDNWSGHVLPTSTDDVCIQGFNVVAGGGLQNAGTLRVEGGSLTIAGAQITVAGASEINAPLTVSSGTLTGAGNITVGGTFSWTGGTVSGSGILTTNGATSIGGTATKGLFAHRWDVNGPVTWTDAGTVSLSSGAVINNASTWDCQSDAVLYWAVGAATAFNNSGTFKKSGGIGTTSVQVPFYNTGSVLLQTGVMSFTWGGSSSSSFDASPGTTLGFQGSTYQFDAGTTITGSGTLLLDVGTLTVNAAVLVPSGITFDMQGGILAGLGTLTVDGPLNWTGGTMQSGVTTCNGALNISGTAAKGMQSSRVLNVNAVATLTGTGNVTVSSAAVINNSATGTWDCQSDATIVWGVGTAPSFNNLGTFKKSAGTTTIVQMPFVNTGAVLVQSGTVDFTQGTSSSTGSFDVAATRTVQFGGSTWNLDSGTTFTGAGRVLLTATTLNVNAAVEIPATMSFEMTGGIVAGLGTLTVKGPFDWTGGTMQGAGITNCEGPFDIGGTAAKGIQTSRVVNAKAATTLAGTGNLAVSSSGVVNNSGTWDCQTDATIVWGVGSAPSFNNSGTFKKTAGTTTLVQMPFYNTGSTLVQAGTISLTSGGNSSSGFDIASGTTLLFNGGAYNLDAGTLFTGSGTIVLGTATWNVNAAVSTPPTITFNMSGATAAMNGTGTLTTYGPFNWTAGSMGSAGVTTCEGILTLSGTAGKGISGRVLNTNGITTWSGAGTNLGMSSSAIVNNNGTWQVLNDATIFWGVGSAPNFRNFGTFQKSIGAGTTSLTLPFSNSGTVDVQSGILSVNNFTQTAGTTKLTGGAFTDTTTITIQGGTLAGSGTVTGPVVVSGTGALSPGLSPGALSLATSYVQQAPNGAFHVELGGTSPAQYDRAAVTGAATLAGVLEVSLIGGFVPQPGDTFTILTYGSHTGTFTEVLPSTGCIGWRVSYGATAVVLTAASVPEEMSALSFTSKTALSWSPAPLYASTSYDVLRGDLDKLPVGPGADETCLAPSTTSTTATDATTPVTARGFWYLVRERVTGCGVGTYGFETGGQERISAGCP